MLSVLFIMIIAAADEEVSPKRCERIRPESPQLRRQSGTDRISRSGTQLRRPERGRSNLTRQTVEPRRTPCVALGRFSTCVSGGDSVVEGRRPLRAYFKTRAYGAQ